MGQSTAAKAAQFMPANERRKRTLPCGVSRAAPGRKRLGSLRVARLVPCSSPLPVHARHAPESRCRPGLFDLPNPTGACRIAAASASTGCTWRCTRRGESRPAGSSTVKAAAPGRTRSRPRMPGRSTPIRFSNRSLNSSFATHSRPPPTRPRRLLRASRRRLTLNERFVPESRREGARGLLEVPAQERLSAPGDSAHERLSAPGGRGCPGRARACVFSRVRVTLCGDLSPLCLASARSMSLRTRRLSWP
jgi:hypothetical protein